MIKIKIFDEGFVILVNGKKVNTPTEVICKDEDVELLSKKFSELGIKQYSIITNIKQQSFDIVNTEVLVTKTKVSPNKFILNYIKDNIDDRDHKPLLANRNILKEVSNTGIVDYTADMSSVKNQGELGSCVGFAVTAMKEWQERKEYLDEVAKGKVYKRKDEYYDLSEQWVYYKSKEIDIWPDEEGTSIRYAMKILKTVGVPVETAWPYNDVVVGEPKRWANLVSKWSLCGEYLRLNTPEDIIISLRDNGPLPVGVGCYIEIFNPSFDGIVSYPKDSKTCYGGHAICLVGWNPETKMFKFKNSWGTSWGQNGYGYLPYDYIKDFCWDAWMIKDLSVTKEMLKNIQ